MAPPVIDVDSHWTFAWEFDFKSSPLKKFASKMPDEAGMLAHFLLSDLTLSLPQAERPDPKTIFPAFEREDGRIDHISDFWRLSVFKSDVNQRISWMNQIGIDYSIVNSSGFAGAFGLLDDVLDRQDYCRRSNDILAEELGGGIHAARLGGVTYADLSDLDWAIAEIGRMRALGSRAFSIYASPVEGKSLGHPHFDRLWSAVVDYGMIISVHIGLAPSVFGEWGRLGLDVTDPKQRAAFMRMSNSQRYQSVELFLSSMLFGGVLERHPKLTILIAELYAYWLPNFMRRMETLTHTNTEFGFGPWGHERTAVEYLRQQVRVSPLVGLGDFNALEVLAQEPKMIVFSSDYPHAEGNADPIELFGPGLRQMDPATQTAFMGKTMAESFERMGDPLLVHA